MVDVQRELRVFCKLSRLRMPSRAALYRARRLLPLAGHRVSDLPVEVQESLYNLAPDALVSGEQLVFYAFNYGTTAAMSFAASLPVVCLERAALRGGWRPKSLSLLESVLRTRRG
jgi:hypothetical protein